MVDKGGKSDLAERLAKKRLATQEAGAEVEEDFRVLMGELASKYQPEYCHHLVQRGRKGWSLREVAAEIGVVRKTLYNWSQNYVEFEQAMEFFKEARIAYYEKIYRENADGTIKGNAGLTSMFLSRHASEDYADPNKKLIGVVDTTMDSFAKIVAEISSSPFALAAANPHFEDEEDVEDAD